MKKIQILLLCIICSLPIYSQEFTLDIGGQNITYSVISKRNKTCAVIKGNQVSGSLKLPETVQYDGEDYIITEIGTSAFFNCTKISSIVISSQVTTIKSKAFAYCSGAVSLTLGESVTTIESAAFAECSSLRYIYLDDNILYIGDKAFLTCNKLESISIPSSVKSIGDDAFNYCWSLKRVDISSLDAWCNINFVSSTSNPLNYAGNLYLDNQKIEDLVVPNNIDAIGSYAFAGAKCITSITFGNPAMTIGKGAFNKCTGLQKIYISDMKSWCRYIFTNYESNPLQFAKHLIVNGEEVHDITIPNCITKIENFAFYKWSELRSVKMSNSIVSIGQEAFSCCTGLQSIEIPNSVKEISYNVFQGCSNLRNVEIGSSVQSIESGVFSDCWLEEVTVNSIIPPYISYSTFTTGAYMDVTLKVPIEAVDLYKNNSIWGKFEYIEGFISDECPSGIEDLEADRDAMVEYYNLQGVKITNPTPGVYIKRQGSKITKVVL